MHFFAFNGRIEAKAKHHNIGCFRAAHRFLDPVSHLTEVLHPVLEQMAAHRIIDARIGRNVFPDSFKHGNVFRCRTFIIAHQRLAAVRIRSDDGDGFNFIFIKRKDVVVFQQHQSFFGSFQR